MATSSIIPVPVLGTQGFATDSVTKFSTLLAHLFASDYNQTYLYPGKVISLARIFEQSGTDIAALQGQLQQTLSSYFSRYYPQGCTVTVVATANDSSNSQYTVKLTVRVYDDGAPIDTAWQFTSKDNVLGNLINLNNYGT